MKFWPSNESSKTNELKLPNDITFASTEDLIAELLKRHDAMIITGTRFTNKNGEYIEVRRWVGHHYSLLALASHVMHVLNREKEGNMQYGPPMKDR